MSIIGKIFSSSSGAKIAESAKETVSIIGKTIDATTSSDEEKLTLKNKLSDIVFDSLLKTYELQAKLVNAEANGNWLQRNWRPIIMIEFAQIVIYNKFIAPLFGLTVVDLDPDFWRLLEIGIGGYVVGRSVEKVASTVTKNVDISFLKKKNRKLD